MTLRPHILAAAILLVAVGIIFVLVGQTGVSTGVYLPNPTFTPVPTLTPTPTATPTPAASNWTEVAPGQLSHTLNTNASLAYEHTTLDAVVELYGIEKPPADTAYPLVDVLEKVLDSLKSQAVEVGLQTPPDAYEDAVIRVFNGMPVVMIKAVIPPQDVQGQPFGGLVISLGAVDNGNGAVTTILYQVRGEPDAASYADYFAWLADNTATLNWNAQPTPESTAEATAETTEAAPEATAQATEQAAPVSTAAATEAAPEATAQATEEAASASTAEATEEATPVATEAATEEPQALAVTATPVGPVETWAEAQPGIYYYAKNPQVQALLGSDIVPLATFIAESGLTPPAADSPTPLVDLLAQLKAMLTEQIDQEKLTVEEGAFADPTMTEFGGVELAFLHLALAPQTMGDGSAYPGLEISMGLIDLGDGNIRIIRYQLQGEPNAEAYADFITWLEENAAQLATAPTPTAEATAEATEAAPESGATQTP